VPTLRFSTLLQKHKIQCVDILQIDTEGYDYEILQMLDYDVVKPALIHFENNFLTSQEMSGCSQLLARHGYRLLTMGIDTIVYQQVRSGFGRRAELSALDADSRRL